MLISDYNTLDFSANSPGEFFSIQRQTAGFQVLNIVLNLILPIFGIILPGFILK